jgi:hypothetical protein
MARAQQPDMSAGGHVHRRAAASRVTHRQPAVLPLGERKFSTSGTSQLVCPGISLIQCLDSPRIPVH